MYRAKIKPPLSMMERRIPQNSKYKDTKSKIDSGTTVNKVRQISQKEFLKRRDETFRRITCKCLADLFTEYEDNGKCAVEPEMMAKMVERDGKYCLDRVPVNNNSAGPRVISYEADEVEEYDAPYLILDTRSKEEFASNRLQRAQSFPSSFVCRDYVLPQMQKFKNQENYLIILYDLEDTTVAQTAHVLVQRGFDNIYVLTGGILEYADSHPEHLEGIPFPKRAVDPQKKLIAREVMRGSPALSVSGAKSVKKEADTTKSRKNMTKESMLSCAETAQSREDGVAGYDSDASIYCVRHGHQLSCFRPFQRFRIGWKADGIIQSSRSCHCSNIYMQRCHLSLMHSDGISGKAGILKRHITKESLDFYEKMMQLKEMQWIVKWEEYTEFHTKPFLPLWRVNQPSFSRESYCLDCQENQKKSLGDSENEGVHMRTQTPSWKSMLSTFLHVTNDSSWSRQRKLMLRAGIPIARRGTIWWKCTLAEQKKASAADSYGELVERSQLWLSPRVVMEIEKDLPRTFAMELNAEKSSDRASNPMSELRRILQAYSLRNPCVGYCQSMNFLAAMLLQQLAEEETFWVLAVIVEDLIPQFHERNMRGSRVEQLVLSDLVEQKLPNLYAHFQQLGVEFGPFAMKWFLCLFINTLPLEMVMRIWDVFLYEGGHVVLRVALTLLKLSEHQLLLCEDAMEVYATLKFTHESLGALLKPEQSRLLYGDECTCDILIRLAMNTGFLGGISLDGLQALREYYAANIETRLRKKHLQKRKSQAMEIYRLFDVDCGVDFDYVTEDESIGDYDAICTAEELMDYDLVDEFDTIDDAGCSKFGLIENLRFQAQCDADQEASDCFVSVHVCPRQKPCVGCGSF
uniref:Uncharacterized protein AlNc14C28G2689 n=1 Tax=Albugo laibachii Nc14 TaxID=890382 RepID=F0W760_9STRA|nr:sporangia induced conserved hypothetical protein [Albugo laibachii Nc14]|eukprot:CCA16959.1 sporangia induced conserved hypothetical protein [Albugo laibachii Nc14]